MSGQTSGSISLDTSALTGAVVQGLQPVIDQVNSNLERLAGLLASVALDEDSAVEVLARHLPEEFFLPDGVFQIRVAGHLAEHLAQAGYALVAVAGPALEFEARKNGFRGVVADVAPVLDPVTAQAVREDQWFAPGREA